MAGVTTEETGAGRSYEGASTGLQQQRCQAGEALAEWRSSEQVENGSPSTSPPYWDSNDDGDGGPKPSDLYGKYTWKIDKFSQINKRELRSNAFEVGATNGWSHFAQFTIAVVNKDPKKSKYSDTLHRFWKKEHDWGWKKFMELAKVLDGFIDADALIIKAQVQVIRERADRPFRCLDCQYRRELVRVYLTNVEQICRRFVEERRAKLGKLLEDKARWSSGLKSLEGQNKVKKSRSKYLEAEELPVPIIGIEKETFILVDDVLLLLERAAIEPLPPQDEKGPQNRTKDGTAGEEFNKDSIERDERRLTELGRLTIEIFVLAHIFSKIEVAYQEAVALKKQEELIREEEAAGLAEIELKARRGIMDKEKKSKKKQGKQKKNNRRGKYKGRDEKTGSALQDKIEQDSPTAEIKERPAEAEIILEKSEVVEYVSDVTDSVDGAPDTPQPDDEDRNMSPVNWDTDTSEIHPPRDASGSGVSGPSGAQNGTEGRIPSALDDSSSTCSSDSVPSVRSVPHKGNSNYNKTKNLLAGSHNHQGRQTSRTSDWVNGEPRQPLAAILDARHLNDTSRSSNRVESLSQAAQSLHDIVVNGTEHQVGKKEEETGPSHRDFSAEDVDVETLLPRSPSNGVAPLILEPKSDVPTGSALVKKPSSDSPKQVDNSLLLTNSADNAAPSKPASQKLSTSKPAGKLQKQVSAENLPSRDAMEPGQQKFSTSEPAEKPSTDKPAVPPIPVMSRPLSAPLVIGHRPPVSVVSAVQTAPVLAQSVSAAGRLGPETTAYTSASYVPQSYRNAMMGCPVGGSSSAFPQNRSPSSVVNASHPYSQAPTIVSAPLFSPLMSERMDPNPSSMKPSLSFGMVNHHDMMQNGTLLIEHRHRNSSRNLHGDHNSLVNDMQALDRNTPMQSSRSRDHLPSDFPPSMSGRQDSVLQEEFPHLDIINDLLDDEYRVGMAARVMNSDYQRFGGGAHMNRQYTFPGDVGPSVSSSGFERTRSYHGDGFQHGYGTSRRSYDALRDMIPGASYVNGQGDGFMPNQWQMAGSDSALLSVRNMDDNNYPHHIPDYTNLGGGINGYTVFRPSNGL